MINGKPNTTKGADLLAELSAQLNQSRSSGWETGDQGYLGNYTDCISLNQYKASHHNFVGPLCTMCNDPPCGGGGGNSSAVALRHNASGLCLIPIDAAKLAPVSLGSCSSSSAFAWSVKGGTIRLALNSQSPLCLRPTNPPKVPASCVDGTHIMVGENACIQLNSQAELASPDCTTQRLCVDDMAGAPVLGSCTGAGSQPAAIWDVLTSLPPS